MISLSPVVDGSFASRLCLALVHSLWQVGALAAGLWILERLWKRQSVEVAYGCYVAALTVAVAAVPITFAWLDVQSADDFAQIQRHSPGPVAAADLARPIDAAAPIEDASDAGISETAQPAAASASPIATVPPVDTQPFAIDRLRRAWAALASWISGLYACGVVLMLARIFKGVWYVQRLRARATLVEDGPLNAALDSLAAAWRLRVVPALARVEGIAVPKVIGLLRPTILMPVAAASGVPAAELEMILAHELAHVRRYDLWVNLLQRLAEALLFFNPALWLLSRRASALREFCCDELTCRTLSDQNAQPRVRYAQALVHVAELTQYGRTIDQSEKLSEIASLAASGRSASELRRRVARLLGEPLREPLQLSRGGVLVLATLVFLFLLAPAISFSNNGQPAGPADESRDERSPAQLPLTNPADDNRAVSVDETAAEKAFLSGRLVMEDGTPAIAKGRLSSDVTTPRGNGYFTTVDQSTDRFAIRVVPGTVWLRYSAKGFAPAWVGPLELAPGQRMEEVELVLTAGVSLAVQVSGEQGEPIPGATVFPWPVLGGTATGTHLKETTNQQGQALLEHMGRMPYQFNVTAAGYQPLRTDHLDVATKKQLELVMKPSEPATGVVLDGRGQPAAGAVLRLCAQAAASSGMSGVDTVVAIADQQGRFLLDQLASDTRYLFLFETTDLARRMVSSITAGQSDLEIQVPPRRDLRLRLFGDIGTLPKRKGKPFVVIGQPYHLLAANGSSYAGSIGDAALVTPTTEGGLVEYRGLIEGEVNITAGKQTRTVEAQEGLTEVVLQLPQGAAAEQKASISGRIVMEDGTPAIAKGWLHYDLNKASGGGHVGGTGGRFTDRFELSLAPGSVWLKYFPTGFAPTALGPLELAPGERLENLELVLRPGTKLRLQIQGEQGEPIPRATVLPLPVAGGNSSGPNLAEMADERGQVLLEHVGQMPYQFNVTAPGYEPLRTDHLDVVAKKQLALVMKRSDPATGIVLDAQGQPAAGAVLRLEVEIMPETAFFSGGKVMATTDQRGRFTLDQLARDWQYVFLIETADKARLAVHTIEAGLSDLQIQVPPRRDLRLRLVGDIATLRKKEGKLYVGVQQPYEHRFQPANGPGFGTSGLIQGEAFVTPTTEGGLAEYPGLIEGEVNITAGKQTKTVYVQDGVTEVVLQLDQGEP